VSRVSIIIPVVGDLEGLENTLVSVLENRPARSQVVVALGCPYDDPYELASEIEFVRAPDGAPLAAVLNTALAACRAPVAHVLSCGVEATAGWTDAAMPLFDDREVAAVVPLVLQKDDPQRIVAAGVLCRPSGAVRAVAAGRTLEAALKKTLAPDGPDILAAFFHTAALRAIGGFDTAVGDDLVAADTALALRAAGFCCALQPHCCVYADEHVRAVSAGALRRGYEAEKFFWRWAAAHGRIRSFVHHGLSLGVELAQCPLRPKKGLELIGRALGLLRCAAIGSERSAVAQPQEAEQQRASRPHFAARPDLPLQPDTTSAIVSSRQAGAV
jgi:hypothetical protein